MEFSRGLERNRMRANKLKLNPHKMELLAVGPDLTLGSGSDLVLDGVVLLPQKAQVGSLVWMCVNKLRYNLGKMEVLVVHCNT